MKYADEGNSAAQYELGHLYAEGRVLKQDWHKIAMWWMNAAMRDHHEAQLEIGRMFAAGDRGVKRNVRLALVNFILADKAGVPGAAEELRLFHGQVTDQELEKVQKMLSERKPVLGREMAFILSSQMLLEN
jgi:TPR repeat protein